MNIVTYAAIDCCGIHPAVFDQAVGHRFIKNDYRSRQDWLSFASKIRQDKLFENRMTVIKMTVIKIGHGSIFLWSGVGRLRTREAHASDRGAVRHGWIGPQPVSFARKAARLRQSIGIEWLPRRTQGYDTWKVFDRYLIEYIPVQNRLSRSTSHPGKNTFCKATPPKQTVKMAPTQVVIQPPSVLSIKGEKGHKITVSRYICDCVNFC